jgi:hypothetical protein
MESLFKRPVTLIVRGCVTSVAQHCRVDHSGRAIAGIAGSNSAKDINVCLLCLLCVV